MEKYNLTSKKIIYQSSSPWLILVAVLVIFFIMGFCTYWDYKIDGIIFNDIELYKKQSYSILIIIFVVVVSTFFFYSKIVIADNELIIHRTKLLFWIKPFKVKVLDIQKVTIYLARVPYFIISYLHNADSTKTVTVVCKKTVWIMGLRKKSEKQLVIKLDEFGVNVYERCGNIMLKLPRKKYVNENKNMLRG